MNPLWFVARASGIVAALLLAAVVALGVIRAERWAHRSWPRFATNHLHRSLSWLFLGVVVVHVTTVVLDGYAPIAIWDSVAPFLSAYRRWWTGLGTIAFDLSLVVLATTTLIRVLGHRVWRWLHSSSYVALPVALVHAVGTGTDTRQWWALALLALGLVAGAGATLWRLCGRTMGAGLLELGARAIGAALVVSGALALVVFTAAGPLQDGWARTAGTPPTLLASGVSGSSASAPLAPGLDDTLAGGPAQVTSAGRDVHLSDTVDPTLSVVVEVETGSPETASITVLRSGDVVCIATAPLEDVLTGSCGGTQISVALDASANGDVTGGLTTNAG